MFEFEHYHVRRKVVSIDLLSQLKGPQSCMEIIYLLISVSLLVALIFLGAFIWSVKSGQFDDTYGSSVRFLHDDDEDPKS